MRKGNRVAKNQLGFTLVEIMVAAGLLGVLSVGLVNIISNTQKTSRKITEVSEVNQLYQSALLVLAKEANCSATVAPVANTVMPTANTGVELAAIRRDTTAGTADALIADTKISPALYLHSIQLFGWYNPATFPNSGAAPGDTFVDPTTGDNMVYGEAAIRIRLNKGSLKIDDLDSDYASLSASDKAKVDKAKTNSLGHYKTDKVIPIRILYNLTTSQIVSCAQSNTQFVAAGCDSISGVFQNPHCKNIHVGVATSVANTTPAIISNGNLEIRTDVAGGPVSNGGQASLGVGVAAPAGLGHIRTSGSIGVGVATPAGNGNIQTQGGIGVNMAPGVDGSIRTSNSIYVDAAGIEVNAGGIDVTAGGVNVASGGVNVTNGGLDVTNDGGIIRNGGLRVNTTDSLPSNTSIRTNQDIFINNPTDARDNNAATIGWVKGHVGTVLAPSAGEVSGIVAGILNADQSNAYQATKTAICGAITIDGLGDSPECVWNSTYTLSNTLAKDKQTITWKKGTAKTASTTIRRGCTDTNSCSKVCINSVCRTSWNLSYSTYQATLSSCAWNALSSLSDKAESTCPSGKVATGIRVYDISTYYDTSEQKNKTGSEVAVRCCNVNYQRAQ